MSPSVFMEVSGRYIHRSVSQWVELVWTVEKELAFLEYVESCGLGNWLDISAKLGSMSPLECRRHYESTYVSGIMSSVYKSPRSIMDLNTKDKSDDDLFAIRKAHFRVPLDFCKKLGLMPKRGDYECDYDNNAEMFIAQIRSDFLGDELYRDLALVRIDMFTEILRRRRLRHMVAAKLNLLTHALPKLIPLKATSNGHGNGHGHAMFDRSQLSGGGDKAARRRLISQRRCGGRMLQSTRCGHLFEKPGTSDNLPVEEAVKQPPSSIESLQDSGVAFSDSLSHSVPSVDTAATASASSPAEDMTTYEGNSRAASPTTAFTRPWHCSSPIVDFSPLGAVSSVNPSGIFPSLPISLPWIITKGSGASQHLSNVKEKSPNQSIRDISSSKPLANCCIPPHFAEPLKPLLRFLSPSEANKLLHQLHREHVLRQEIEQLQQLKRSQGVFLDDTHLAGEVMSAASGDSDESSPEDTRQGLASRTGAASMPLRRRRGIVFGATRRSKRRANRLSALVGVRRACGSRRSGANGSLSGSGVAPKSRGRPLLHNQGNRQQHQLIRM
ncbi:Transcriptional adapter 2B [Echinococcus multilocularis]|uniref:Transcriptional adapter 2B n=1 Tax=Echinococcus multilocularis TaxID=6211 RepID=A0A068YF93_ECHMU|nr:Transcriptional adapter 2B [Echinococcus multilocularis]